MPGPKSERLLQQRIEAVPRALSNATPDQQLEEGMNVFISVLQDVERDVVVK